MWSVISEPLGAHKELQLVCLSHWTVSGTTINSITNGVSLGQDYLFIQPMVNVFLKYVFLLFLLGAVLVVQKLHTNYFLRSEISLRED